MIMKYGAMQASMGTDEAVEGQFQLDIGFSTVLKSPGTALVGWGVVKRLPEKRRIQGKWCLQRRPMLVGVRKTCLKSNSMSVDCIRV